ncbi:MAG: tetratricopeptide (TPR) repeat protein [Hyphomicrobiaceae bacterium]|jgi:tetratricopeptide (TPR) repeat protein
MAAILVCALGFSACAPRNRVAELAQLSHRSNAAGHLELAIQQTRVALEACREKYGVADDHTLRLQLILADRLSRNGDHHESSNERNAIDSLLTSRAPNDNQIDITIALLESRGHAALLRDDLEEASRQYRRIDDVCPSEPSLLGRIFCGRKSSFHLWRAYEARGMLKEAAGVAIPAHANVPPSPFDKERHDLADTVKALFSVAAYPQTVALAEEAANHWENRADTRKRAPVRMGVNLFRDLGTVPGRFYQLAPMVTEERIAALERLGAFTEADAVRTRDLAYWSRPDRGEELLSEAIRLDDQEKLIRGQKLGLYGSRGYYRRKKHRFADALSDYDHARQDVEASWTATAGQGHSGRKALAVYFGLLRAIGEMRAERGQFDQAREAFETFRELAARWRTPQHRESLDAEAYLADLLERQGHDEQASKMWRGLLETTDEVRGSDHPDTAWTAWRLAKVERRLGRSSDADRHEAMAARIWEQSPRLRQEATEKARAILAG